MDRPPHPRCSAGQTTPCEKDTYNPNINAKVGSACIDCPRYSETATFASTRLDQCFCRNGFVQVDDAADGSFQCMCPPGYAREEQKNPDTGVQEGVCTRCDRGMYKSVIGNEICKVCPFEPASTFDDGATSVDECVCAIGWYMMPDLSSPRISGWYDRNRSGFSPSCTRCDAERTDCFDRGTTVITMPVKAGYWRVNEFTARVEKCPQEEHVAICIGSNVDPSNASTASGARWRLRSVAGSSMCREGHDETKQPT